MSSRFKDGGGFEEAAAYSRAARQGDVIAVSGTAATGPDGAALHPGDAYAQTREAIRARSRPRPSSEPRARTSSGPGSIYCRVASGRDPCGHTRRRSRASTLRTPPCTSPADPAGSVVEFELDAVLPAS